MEDTMRINRTVFFVTSLLLLMGYASHVWSQTARRGTQEFLGAGSYSWTAPAGVTTLTVEFWGAGGGGTQRITPNARSGNGGGSGAFVRSVVKVVRGQTYYINVGAGGAGDSGSGVGSPGEATQITDSSGTVLMSAGGGSGGSKNPDTGGAGGIPDPTAGVQRNGKQGGKSNGIGGNLGGAAILGSVGLPYFMDGGAGAGYRSTGNGGDGGSGYAIIFW
jgi:hypothetical protein